MSRKVSDDTIVQEFETVLEDMADADAAMSWSHEPGFGDVGIAQFGDHVGMGGEIYEGSWSEAKEELKQDGFREAPDKGGEIRNTEQEISVEHAAWAVADNLDVDVDRVFDVIERETGLGGFSYAYIVTSGYAEVYEER